MKIICSNVGIEPSHECEECCVMYKVCGTYKVWAESQGVDIRGALEKLFDKLFNRRPEL